MPSVPLTFFFVALVILLGFITAKTFQLTRVPDIPILLSFGLLIGPLNRAAVPHGWGNTFLSENLQVDTLKDFAPFVSALALIVILFDSGLKLDFTQFGRSMRPAFLHTLPTFLLTVLAVALIADFVIGMPPLLAVVLGVALSNVGQTVSASLIRDIKLDQETRSIYFVEMAIYDLVSIPLLVSLLEFAHGAPGGGEAGTFTQSLARVISISVLLGIVGGVVWIYVLMRMRDRTYAYMITLAGLLAVYSVNSFLGGSGPVSVLIFGLVVGNRERVLRMLGSDAPAGDRGELVHVFHDEITFFVRAFYFIFLGITFSTGTRAESAILPRAQLLGFDAHPATLYLLGVGFIFGAIVLARWLVVRFVSARTRPQRRALAVVYGRGLGTAVLATYPFTLAEFQPGTAYHALFAPWEAIFVNTALLIILLTVLGTTVGVWWMESRGRRVAESPFAVDPLQAAKE